MPLCDLCQKVDIHSMMIGAGERQEDIAINFFRDDWGFLDDVQPYRHSPDVSIVHANSEFCDFCKLLWNAWSDFISEDPWAELSCKALSKSYWSLPKRKEDGVFLSIFKIRNRRTARLYAEFRDGDYRWGCFSFDLSKNWECECCRHSTCSPFKCLIDRDEYTASNELETLLLDNVPADSSSIECLSTAQRWMKTCLLHHKSCHRTLSSSELQFMPTRVINVGDGSRSPFLHITSIGEVGSWVSLSYCWGGNSDFVLTKSTLRALVEGPDLQNFPKTIQDAIIITQSLGVRFLWVDALCIFQDSLDDWQSEAPKMVDIYHYAVLTIIAADSPAVSTGILKQRETIPSCSLPWEVPELPRLGNLAIEAEDRKTDLSIGRSVSVTLNKADYQRNHLPDPSNSRWASRGWTLQEALLAWRTLSYTSTQMLWGCDTLKVWEDGQSATETSLYSGNPISFQKYSKSLRPSAYRNPAALYDIYHDWYQIVTVYSSRQLTKEADKLAAIEGLARRIQLHVLDSYRAGLWEKDLIFGLLWVWAEFNDPSATLNEQNSALIWPSWNWTSLHDQVRWCFAPQRRSAETDYRYKELGRIEAVILDYSAKSHYGMVNRGELVLSAPCHWLLGKRALSNALRDIMDGKQRPSKVHAFLQEALVTNREFQQRHLHHDSQEVAALQHARVDKISPIKDESVVAPPEGRIAFLILESIQQDKEELESIGVLYRRVGLIILDKIWAKQARQSEIVANEAFAELDMQAQWPLESFHVV